MPLKDSLARKEYDQNYKRMHREERRTRDLLKIRRHKEWMTAIRFAQGCACGRHDGKLVHHHLDPTVKGADVSCMSNNSTRSILDEIAKCTVMCDSCHASIHRRAGHLNV